MWMPIKKLRDDLETHRKQTTDSINQLRGDVEEFRRAISSLNAGFEKLATNGVATAVNKLNAEVFQESKKSGTLADSWFTAYGIEYPEVATLAGKVNAIIDYLGLDLKVEPKEIKESKIVAKKSKKGSK